jgi:hypothetical protein
MKRCRPLSVCLRLSFTIVILILLSPVSYADVVFTRGGVASFIEITDGPSGNEYTQLMAGSLSGEAACAKTGQFPAPTPPYADTTYCMCSTGQAYAHFPAEHKIVMYAIERVCNCNWVPSSCQWLESTCLYGTLKDTTPESCKLAGGTYWHKNGHCGKGPCQFTKNCGPDMAGHYICIVTP